MSENNSVEKQIKERLGYDFLRSYKIIKKETIPSKDIDVKICDGKIKWLTVKYTNKYGFSRNIKFSAYSQYLVDGATYRDIHCAINAFNKNIKEMAIITEYDKELLVAIKKHGRVMFTFTQDKINAMVILKSKGLIDSEPDNNIVVISQRGLDVIKGVIPIGEVK